MASQEAAPFIIQQGAIGLKCVAYHLVWAGVFLLKLNGLLKELKAGQGRLAALPGDGYLISKMWQQSRKDLFKGLEGHFMFVAIVDRFGR